MLYDEEFLSILGEFGAANAFPDIEGFEGAAFVHEEARRFGHEEHADKHDGGEDEGGTEHIAPAAALDSVGQRLALWKAEEVTCLDVNEDGSHDIAKYFSQRDVELVQRYQVPTIFASHAFCDVYGHSVEWMRYSSI